jgi:hypothetical protein
MTPEQRAQMQRLTRVRLLTTFELGPTALLMTIFSFANRLGSPGNGLLRLQRLRLHEQLKRLAKVTIKKRPGAINYKIRSSMPAYMPRAAST